MTAEDRVVLVAVVEDPSPLIDRRRPAKLAGAAGSFGLATAGHAADGRRLIDLARRTAAAERRRYGESIDADALARAVGDRVQEDTQRGGTRPYGTALLVAGVDDGPRLVEIDPSGATSPWVADAVGRGAEDAVAHLEREYESGLAVDGALSLAAAALRTAVESLSPANVEAATVGADGYATLSPDRIAAAI